MPDRPNDRLQAGQTPIDDQDPRLVIIVGADQFPRPGLETFFADSNQTIDVETESTCICDAVVRTYCSCNRVCQCVGVCSCAGHVRCSCDSHTIRSGGCRCAPVH